MASELSIIEQFDRNAAQYQEFTVRLEQLLRQLLESKHVAIHSITSRTKTRESLIKKITQKSDSYARIEDITDVAGLRIITYFADNTQDIARIIETEFLIDKERSIDKGAALDPDRFGYSSIHYIVSLSDSRMALPEWATFTGLKAEIQIRSILQHAWAEIQHDLGYKNSREVPATIRRQFARLAGLLEVADSEFTQIRRSISAYDEKIASAISTSPSTVTIDKNSVTQFIIESPVVRDLDSQVADVFKLCIDDKFPPDPSVDKLLFFRLNDIEALNNALKQHATAIVKVASVISSLPATIERDDSFFPRGISILYLCYALASVDRDPVKLETFLQQFMHFRSSPEARTKAVEALIAAVS